MSALDAAAVGGLPVMLEAVMLCCFGIAWPVANVRMLRLRRAEGKGLAFTLIILCGYVCGAAAKLVLAGRSGQGAMAVAPLFWLYFINAASVAMNLALQWHFGIRGRRPARIGA